MSDLETGDYIDYIQYIHIYISKCKDGDDLVLWYEVDAQDVESADLLLLVQGRVPYDSR